MLFAPPRPGLPFRCASPRPQLRALQRLSLLPSMCYERKIKNGFLAIFVLTALVVAAWYTYKDPIRREVEPRLFEDKDLSRRVGSVRDVSLRSATYVQASTSRTGVRTGGYNLYTYSVYGVDASLVVQVRVEDDQKSPTGGLEYSIEYWK